MVQALIARGHQDPVPLDLTMVQQVGAGIGGRDHADPAGKPEVVRLAVVALLTEGHLLIEDVPGVGKTRWPRRWPAPSPARSTGSSSPPT